MKCFREELFNEKAEFVDVHFQSEITENLEATDESEEYEISIETIQETSEFLSKRK